MLLSAPGDAQARGLLDHDHLVQQLRPRHHGHAAVRAAELVAHKMADLCVSRGMHVTVVVVVCVCVSACV
eukprot:1161274-Pelagomonas_calceolata.AAC.9